VAREGDDYHETHHQATYQSLLGGNETQEAHPVASSFRQIKYLITTAMTAGHEPIIQARDQAESNGLLTILQLKSEESTVASTATNLGEYCETETNDS